MPKTIDPPRTLPGGQGAVRRILGSAIGGSANLVRALLNRRAVLPLCSLDDRMLQDVGLTRDDLDAALSRGLAVDPSRVLAVRRLDRRARMRARQGSAPQAHTGERRSLVSLAHN